MVVELGTRGRFVAGVRAVKGVLGEKRAVIFAHEAWPEGGASGQLDALLIFFLDLALDVLGGPF